MSNWKESLQEHRFRNSGEKQTLSADMPDVLKK